MGNVFGQNHRDSAAGGFKLAIVVLNPGGASSVPDIALAAVVINLHATGSRSANKVILVVVPCRIVEHRIDCIASGRCSVFHVFFKLVLAGIGRSITSI